MEQSLVDQVLELSPSDKMKLLNIIYDSLEKPNETIDEIWYDEAERRLAAFQSGEVQGISAEEVLGNRP